MAEPPPETTHEISRWELIRDILVFQLKLALDGLRDLFLSPISIFLGLLDLVDDRGRRGHRFQRMLELGRGSDRWIDLFKLHEQADAERELNVDGLVGHVERVLVDQVERGGVTKTAKDAIDRSLDRISERR